MCCLPSCACEWFGRLLAEAVQNNARDCSNNWDNLVQLPRSIPYNGVASWCRCSLQLHQPIPMLNQKIIQEERDISSWNCWRKLEPMWSTPLLKESPLRLEQCVWGLLHPTSETLWGWRFHSLSWQTVPVLDHLLWIFLSLYPRRYRPHLTDMHPTDSLGCHSPGNLFLRITAWILQCAGTGMSYCSVTLSCVKWREGMGCVCALSPAQQQGETQEA